MNAPPSDARLRELVELAKRVTPLSEQDLVAEVSRRVGPADRVVCGLNFRYAGHRTPQEAEQRLRELIGPVGRLDIVSNAPSA